MNGQSSVSLLAFTLRLGLFTHGELPMVAYS